MGVSIPAICCRCLRASARNPRQTVNFVNYRRPRQSVLRRSGVRASLPKFRVLLSHVTGNIRNIRLETLPARACQPRPSAHRKRNLIRE